jgi:hypothetical protein
VLVEVLISVNGVLSNLIANLMHGPWTQNRPLLLAACAGVGLAIAFLTWWVQRVAMPAGGEAGAADQLPRPLDRPSRGVSGGDTWYPPHDGPTARPGVNPNGPRFRPPVSGPADPWTDRWEFQDTAVPAYRRPAVRRTAVPSGFAQLGAATLDALIIAFWAVALIWPVALLGAFGDPQFLGPLRSNVTTLTRPFTVCSMLAIAVVVGLDLLPSRGGRVLAGWELVPPLAVLACMAALVVVAIVSEFAHALDFTQRLPLDPTLVWMSCLTPVVFLVVMELGGLRSPDNGTDTLVVVVGVSVVFAISMFFS